MEWKRYSALDYAIRVPPGFPSGPPRYKCRAFERFPGSSRIERSISSGKCLMGGREHCAAQKSLLLSQTLVSDKHVLVGVTMPVRLLMRVSDAWIQFVQG